MNLIAELTLLGTKGGPSLRELGPSVMPTSSLLKIADKRIVIDCGLGVSRGLIEAGCALKSITHIFITHHHSDHTLELGGLLHTAWTSGLASEVEVYGPPGTEKLWEGFLAMMDYDINLRIGDEGRPDLRDLVKINIYQAGEIMRSDDLCVNAMNNVHPPVEHSYALTFESADKKISFTGDTAYFPELAAFLADADILVSEAMLEKGIAYITKRIANSATLREHLYAAHTLAADVGRLATQARAKRLVLHHLIPPERNICSDEDWLAEIIPAYSGPVQIGRDGLSISF